MHTRLGLIIVSIFMAGNAFGAAVSESLYDLSDEGAIVTWLKLGPIPDASDSSPLSGHDADYLSGEASASPKTNDCSIIRDATYSWTVFSSVSEPIRLSDRERPAEKSCEYFFCLLDSGRDGDTVLQIARDDTAKVWLDGLMVYNNAQPNADSEKRDEVKVALRKGRQPLLVKVCQNDGFWGFSIRVKDTEGKVPDDVQVVLPGELDESEYRDSLMQIRSLPLVDRAGHQLLRLQLTPFVRPPSVESVTVYSIETPDIPVWTGTALTKRSVQIPIARKNEPQEVLLRIGLKGRIFESRITVNPCRDWRVYLLPGSHVDIGYTNLQAIVMADHKNYYRQAWNIYEESLRTGSMRDAQYVWNPEVNWVVKDFLCTEPVGDRKRLLDYFRRGVFSMDALYCHLLTALCGDEELIRSVYYSVHLAEREQLPAVESAMITDVPGYTWGIVPVLAGAGVKYFELGPNYDARIGFATKSLGYHPYYWVGPDGVSKVLVWNTGEGYSNTFDMLRSEGGIDRFLDTLSRYEADADYPYDVAQFRAYLVDNTPPPTHLSQMVQDWNQQYQFPRLILSGAPAAFKDLESKYGDKIPSHRGDYTPYWEDGAASSARETSMNRMATLRMPEAEKAWALARVAGYGEPVPLQQIEQGYDYAMLYSEHTWGAHTSISEPTSFFTQDQWRVKRGFAENAMWLSTQLKRDGLRTLSGQIQCATPYLFAVWNLTQWPRSEEAVLPYQGAVNELASAEQWMAVDSEGNTAPVVREERGYVFQTQNVPPFGYRVYQFIPQSYATIEPPVSVSAADGILQGGEWEIKADPQTGGVASLVYLPQNRQWVDTNSAYKVNQYLHVLGLNGKDSKSAKQVSFLAKTEGAHRSLVADIQGPGVEWLRQEIHLFPEQNRIDFINTMKKSDIRDKEALRFAFPFQVADGQFTLEIPLASMHPETDQIPGANRNIYTVRRWIDITNAERGVTLVTHDAPLVELCDLHAEQEWLERLPLVNTHLYSFAMNNYWFTNYKASQGGPAVFRYSLWFHEGAGKPSQSTRFADEVSSPLCVVPLPFSDASGNAPLPPTLLSLISIDAANVLVQDIKWAEDGSGVIVRLRELDGESTKAQLQFSLWKRFQWERRDIAERPIEGERGSVEDGILPVTIGGREIRTYSITLLN